jgi:hypothetical protein
VFVEGGLLLNGEEEKGGSEYFEENLDEDKDGKNNLVGELVVSGELLGDYVDLGF